MIKGIKKVHFFLVLEWFVILGDHFPILINRRFQFVLPLFFIAFFSFMAQLRLTMSEYSSYRGEVDLIHPSMVIEWGSVLQTKSNFFNTF